MFISQKSLCIYYLLCLFSFGVNSYRDNTFEERMAEIENEFLVCFSSDSFTMNNKNELKKSYETFQKEFPQMNFLIRYVAGIFVNLHGQKKVTVDDLASQIYETAVKFYLLGSSNAGVAYHNFCHGMVVAFLTHEFLRDYNYHFKIEDLTHHGILVFSGLFHDAAHPGMGNVIYQMNKPHRKRLVKHVLSRFDEILIGTNKELYVYDGDLAAVIESYKDKDDFVLEDLHTNLTIYAYNILLRPLVKDNKTIGRDIDIIKEAIGFTNMAKPHNELKEHINYIVHIADLFLNGLKNEKLLVEGVKTVYFEFMVEAYEISKINGEKAKIEKFYQEKRANQNLTPNKWNGSMGLVCSATIGGTYKGQPGFNGYVGTFKKHLIDDLKIGGLQFDLIQYYNTNLVVNNKLFMALSEYADNNGVQFKDPLEKAVDDKLKTLKDANITFSLYQDSTITALCENGVEQQDFSKPFLYDGTGLNVNEKENADKAQAIDKRLLII